MNSEAASEDALKALRETFVKVMEGGPTPDFVVVSESVLRRHFGDEAVDAAFANGTASYLTEADEV